MHCGNSPLFISRLQQICNGGLSHAKAPHGRLFSAQIHGRPRALSKSREPAQGINQLFVVNRNPVPAHTFPVSPAISRRQKSLSCADFPKILCVRRPSIRSKLTLLSTAAALAFGLAGTAALAADATGNAPGAKSDITIVKDNAANAPGGTGVEESTESQGATNKQGLSEATPPASGAGSVQAGGDNSSDQGGTGVEGSADSEGATNKSTQDPGATGLNEGPSTGNAPGGTGAEKSAEGGAQNKSAY